MLRMICVKTLGDSISSETIREMTGVEKIEKFLREQSSDSVLSSEGNFFVVDGSNKGRPKRRWKEAIEKNSLLEV